MKWHGFPKNEERRQERIHPGKWIYVCSNQFRDGEPTTRYPNPSLFLTAGNVKKREGVQPAKRKTENMKIRKLNENQVSVSTSEKFTDLTRDMTSDFIRGLLVTIFLERCLNFSSSKHLP